MNRWWLYPALCLVLPVMAEEVLQPRGREAYEAHLKELEAKYGADTSALKQAASAPAARVAPAAPASLPAAPSAPAIETQKVAPVVSPERVASAPPTTISADPAGVLPAGARVNVAITALGTERFRFGGEAIDAGTLHTTLERLARDYRLDTLVLMENEGPIQARHLVELSKLSAQFKVPGLYQKGQTLLAVQAASP